jgi:hypothetical protein
MVEMNGVICCLEACARLTASINKTVSHIEKYKSCIFLTKDSLGYYNTYMLMIHNMSL